MTSRPASRSAGLPSPDRWLPALALGLAAVLCHGSGYAQEWAAPVRGSWVRPDDRPAPGDVTLAGPGAGCELVVEAREPSAVQQAAVFLAGDIEKISGYRPPIVAAPSGQRRAVHLATFAAGRPWPAGRTVGSLPDRRDRRRGLAGGFRPPGHRLCGLHAERAAGD